MTTYKGLKETEARTGEWVVISGIGGLGHVAIQYAKAMGLHIVAMNIAEEKFDLARELGVELAVNATDPGAIVDVLSTTGGGAHGVLVTAISPAAFTQAVACARRRSTVVLVGLPPGAFPTPIFDAVLKRISLRGSIVGTRRDLAETLAFATEGKVKVTVEPLSAVNAVLDRLRRGQVNGRIVLRS